MPFMTASLQVIYYFLAVSDNSLNLIFLYFLEFFLESFIPVQKKSNHSAC